ncbi:helix-turn-helix transcriptional regulator [Nostocoides sp. HKS02]|uniref:helix-turn-helix domain-containing protein n=1 Tax=Nostocoides sp. HKS02 TaxID=1813880 RepID=UPI001E330E98|nr:helix-turn-helix transcriptional regulator [Tetrasphaera sp. HKS02]
MARQMLVRSGADLGAAVAEARRLRGQTQDQLAAAAGVERSYLAKLEAGASVLLLDRALKLLRRLGAEVVVQLSDASAAVEPRP